MADLGEATITLPARCELETTTALRAELLRGLRAGPLVLDCTRLTSIDAAGLQLLCAAALAATRSGDPIAWRAPPTVLLEAASTLGLVEVLGLPATQDR